MNYREFYLKAIFPSPRLIARLIEATSEYRIGKAEARKLVEDHCKMKLELVRSIMEEA